jgi:NAD(P)-dependent dehydrogenase (short-subunit alcohol dehydrogenase family)
VPSFADTVVLITGTARGCGAVLADAFAKSGATVVGRMGRPEELVAAAMYLCSDEARFCTGTTLILDGGFTAQ